MGSVVPSPTPMVGRHEELDRLIAALGRPPAVAVVEGETGIGKTRLVAELAACDELAGRHWLTGACARIREPFPLGPLVGALRGVGEHLTPASLSPVTGALRVLLPELADLLPPAPTPTDDRIGERHRVFRGLVEILAALDRPVLVLEDTHWADEQTVDFLGYLLSDPPAGLSLVLTYRGAEAGAAVRAAASRPAASATRTHVTLRPLDVAQTKALAAAILGLGVVSEEFAGYLWERTSGLPFAIQELLALLKDRGTLIRTDRGWSRRAIDELAVPAGVRDSVLERADRLAPAARSVVDAASVLQTPVPVAVLTAVCPLERASALEGLDEALESGLLTEQSTGTVGLRHMLATQSVYEAIPLHRRQDLHARAATALRTRPPVPLGQIAHHLRRAEDLPAWVDAAEAAADQAIRLGNDTEAAGLIEDVLRNASVTGRRRIELTVKLGTAISAVVPVPDVSDLLRAALDDDPPQPARGQLRWWYALVLDALRVDPERRWRAFVDAIEDLDDQPDLAAWAMIGLGLPNAPGVSLAEHVAWLDRALETVPALEDPTMRALVLGKVAMAFAVIGDPRWSEITDRFVAAAEGHRGHNRTVRAYNSIGELACYSGHYEAARRLLSATHEATSAFDHLDGMEYRRRASLALLAYFDGSWDGLDEECALVLGRVNAQRGVSIIMETVTAGLALARGDHEVTRDLMSRVLPRAVAVREVDLLPLIVNVSLRATLAEGQPETALARTSEAVAVWDNKGLWTVGVRTLPALTEALTAAGRQDEAADLVTRLAGELRDRDAPLAPACLTHARGILAMADGRLAQAAAALTAAAEAYDGLLCVYEGAQAREHAAACLLALDAPEADAVVRSAMDTYRRLGARWDLDRVVTLARRDESPRRGPRGYGDALSPREHEVALLVADGLTNKEIAARLYVSVRTVDKHLSAALRKLELRSRTALATHMSTAALTASSPSGAAVG